MDKKTWTPVSAYDHFGNVSSAWISALRDYAAELESENAALKEQLKGFEAVRELDKKASE